MTAATSHITACTRKQRTLKKAVSYSGIGIHTGECVHMRFVPAPEGSGIVFRRSDLPGSPAIPATVEYVSDTARNTTLSIADVTIYTVEHVLAAVNAYKIDNLFIEVSNIEPPVASGGSEDFVAMIEEAGIAEQEETKPIIALKVPVYHAEGDIQLVALPCDHYRISYTLNYPNNRALKSQFFSVAITSDTFKEEIAPCRTFSLYEEVSYLMDRGLIKGGSLDNAVIIKGNAVFSKGGLRFDDEMVRHKILDVVGDMSLVGFDFLAHIIAIRSGHATNFALAKKILNTITSE